MRLRPALVLAALAALALPAGAHGYSFQAGGSRWETPRIPYYVGASSLRPQARAAAALWNELGMRVRLVETRSRRRAFVRLRYDGRGCVGGVTRVIEAVETRSGPSGRSVTRYIARAQIVLPPGCGRRLTTYVTAHEFGHALGLGHERRRCALMNPSGDRNGISPQCGNQPLYLRSRDIVRADDAAGALALYRRPLISRTLWAYRTSIRF